MSSPFQSVRGHTFYTPLLREPVVLDLGANHGEFSRTLSSRFGGTYHMVEANPRLHQELRVAGRFPVLGCAVTAREGTVRFNLARNDEGSSVLNLPADSIYNCVLDETVEVPGRTLASLVDELGLERIDLLKMDIEGAELEVLAGVDPALMGRVGQMTVEFHGAREFGFGLSREVEEVIRRMEGMGFAWFDFSRPKRTDVLFLNRALYDPRGAERAWWKVRYEYPSSLSRGRSRIIRNSKKWLRRHLKPAPAR
jgi:FkbM family methyltransferase